MPDNYGDWRFIVRIDAPEDATILESQIKQAIYRGVEAIDTEDAIEVIKDWGWQQNG